MTTRSPSCNRTTPAFACCPSSECSKRLYSRHDGAMAPNWFPQPPPGGGALIRREAAGVKALPLSLLPLPPGTPAAMSFTSRHRPVTGPQRRWISARTTATGPSSHVSPPGSNARGHALSGPALLPPGSTCPLRRNSGGRYAGPSRGRGAAPPPPPAPLALKPPTHPHPHPHPHTHPPPAPRTARSGRETLYQLRSCLLCCQRWHSTGEPGRAVHAG